MQHKLKQRGGVYAALTECMQSRLAHQKRQSKGCRFFACAKESGVKYVGYDKLPLETANELNRALSTLPDDVVGYWFDKKNGEYVATKRVQIKYALGDGNIHIVPVKEL